MKNNSNRRDFLKKTALLALAGVSESLIYSPAHARMSSENILHPELAGEDTIFHDADAAFTLPALPYSYDALEPAIDKMTMQIHHDKHHAAYVSNLNKAVIEAKIESPTLQSLCMNASKYSDAVRNNAGGHYNHSLFWTIMKPGGSGAPSGAIADAINSSFGSFEEFKKKMSDAGVKRFGSGWAWLVAKNGKLEIGSTPNQDNPIMDICPVKGTPILALDVWEHAYYLKYQNKRADYIAAWWDLINWDQVSKLLAEAK